MIVVSAKQNGNTLQGGQVVNKVGKYLYDNIDNSFKFQKGPNMFDVYFVILYQIPYLQRLPGKGKDYNDVHEMTINLNIVPYDDKIRINILEMSPDELTLGTKTISHKKLDDLSALKEEVLAYVKKRVEKAYSDYDFYF